ncbi:MAG TPA: hypothetical protein VD841_02620 [Arthrobacter sp.]|nr:hypothetical protein [Arthrobacter sp.]
MQDNAGFYAPLQYSPLWLWAGIGLLAMVLAWYLFVFFSTRTPRGAAAAPRFTPPSDINRLKEAYLLRINAVEADAAAGRLTSRASHQELSLLVRKFARDVTGVDAPRMTLAELDSHPLPGAANAVGRLYPGEFGAEPLPPLGRSAEAAREAVRSWS